MSEAQQTLSKRLGLSLELFPYQTEGVIQIVKKFAGRALLADEMGLGKSAQALAVASLYRDGIIIIISPASLKLNWKVEVLLWLSKFYAAIDICVVKTGKDKLYGKILIFSYEMASIRAEEIARIGAKVIIVDEAHCIKNHKAIRTKKIIPLCKQIPICMLLTGTAILNRPIELWTQLEALNRSMGKYWDYARRYCALKKGRFGWDVTGSSNLNELNQKLRERCMVRRLKSQVLKDLPAKRRVKILVEGVGRSSDIDELRAECAIALQKCGGDLMSARAEMKRRKVTLSGIIFRAYSAVGMLKAGFAAEWIENNSTPILPLVVFAHHRNVMDLIATELKEKQIKFCRIDGSTPVESRQRSVESFQKGELQVALLSITAASTGLTLTKASDMLIVELPFGPGLAAQAEDRIHRIGQKNAALIRYLIAERTIDESLWGMINKKSSIVHGALDGAAVSSFSAESETAGDYWVIVEEILTELSQKKSVSAAPLQQVAT